jgi:hypothetical protein
MSAIHTAAARLQDAVLTTQGGILDRIVAALLDPATRQLVEHAYLEADAGHWVPHVGERVVLPSGETGEVTSLSLSYNDKEVEAEVEASLTAWWAAGDLRPDRPCHHYQGQGAASGKE